DELKPELADVYKEKKTGSNDSWQQAVIDWSSSVAPANLQGILFYKKEKYDRALTCFAENLLNNRKLKGEEYPDTSSTYDYLGGVYREQGRYGQAIEFFSKSLEIMKKVFGEENPKTAASYNNLGEMFGRHGQYGKEMEYFRKALEIRKKVLGEEHSDTAT